MKNLPLLIATLGGTLLLIIGVTFFFGRSIPPEIVDTIKLKAGSRHLLMAEEPQTATPSATPSLSPQEATAQAEATPSAEKKVVQIVEFSDLQCPACKAAAPIREQVRAQFPGQIEFIYRHYPLTQIHQNAMLAAQAAEAAGKFEKFWEYHDVLFEKQSEWETLSNDQAKEKFIEYAVNLKMEKDPFTKELDSDTVKSAVQSDINLGDEIKVTATPTFFVDGKKVSASEVQQAVAQILGS
jgi:protein-disulfide isomerase